MFVSFLGAVIACAVLSHRDGHRGALFVNVCGIVLVAYVLALNLVRLDGVIALAAAGLVSVYVWRVWVRRGRPGGVSAISAAAREDTLSAPPEQR